MITENLYDLVPVACNVVEVDLTSVEWIDEILIARSALLWFIVSDWLATRRNDWTGWAD